LAHKAKQGSIWGIAMPKSPLQIINDHFANDSFLALHEDE